MVLANGRHFALEQAARGVAVRFHVARPESGYPGLLAKLAAELGPLSVMEPAERELRHELAPLFTSGALRRLEHEGWLSRDEDFRRACPRPPYRMDAFYRFMRRKSGWLMERDKPVAGRFSLDAENRKAWTGTPPAPTPPRFAPDAVTQEVGALIASRYAHHPGTLDLEHLPATSEDAHACWRWAKDSCLRWFGPYEDAMSARSSSLFHTRLSPLLNLQRLSAHTLVREALALPIPVASQEGFLRQLLGWREFMRHVHRETDGFRVLPEGRAPQRERAGDGGYAQWTGSAWPSSGGDGGGDGGADPSHLGAKRALPQAYWGVRSGFACLDHVIERVWAEGYSHHITRLMVLANLAMLLDVSPRELTDWFWAAYFDAYDWVVEPNVLAMGTFGVGDLMTTKPYVAGAAYIDRMSDFCGRCAFDPKKSCPFTPLYWAYLARHERALADNPRLAMPLRSLAKRSPAQRERDRRVFAIVTTALAEGRTLAPRDLPPR